MRQFIKRILLILTPLPLLSISNIKLFSLIEYIIPTTVISSYIILLNFPMLTKILHEKPIYFSDLEDNKYNDITIKKRFQYIFIVISQLTTTIIITSIVYYYHTQFHITTLSRTEICGVFGGIVSILTKAESFIAKRLLMILNICREKSADIEESVSKKPRSSSFNILAEV